MFRSNRYIYAQAIDDQVRTTMASSSSLNLQKDKDYKKNNKANDAKEIGKILARNLKEAGISKAVFDRGLYAYKGRVKAVAEGMREEGLTI